MTTTKPIYRSKSVSEMNLVSVHSYGNAKQGEMNKHMKKRKDAYGTPIVKNNGKHRVSFADQFYKEKVAMVSEENEKKGLLKKSKSIGVYEGEIIHIKCNDIVPYCEDTTKNEVKYTIVTKDSFNKNYKKKGEYKEKVNCSECVLF